MRVIHAPSRVALAPRGKLIAGQGQITAASSVAYGVAGDVIMQDGGVAGEGGALPPDQGAAMREMAIRAFIFVGLVIAFMAILVAVAAVAHAVRLRRGPPAALDLDQLHDPPARQA